MRLIMGGKGPVVPRESKEVSQGSKEAPQESTEVSEGSKEALNERWDWRDFRKTFW